MRRKLLIGAGIVCGVIAAALIGLTLFVKSYLQSDKLKDLIIPKAEEVTGRKVEISAINVSIFSGISVQGIHVKEKDGARDFASVKEFVLTYDLMPLLSKKLVISSMKVVEPFLYVTRDENGRFNYEDILDTFESREKKEVSKPPTEGGMPFSITSNNVAFRDVKLEFIDAKKELPQVLILSDADLKVAEGTGKEAVSLSGKVKVKNLDVTLGSETTRTSGTISIEAEEVTYALNTVIGSDTIAATGSVRNYRSAPDIRLDIYAKQLDLVKLTALSSGTKPGEKKLLKAHETRAKDSVKAGSGKKTDITASGEIKVDTALYKGYGIKNLLMKYRYSGGVATIDPVSLHFSSGEKADISGVLKGTLGFHYAFDRGSAADQIKQSSLGKATVDLDKVQVKESKITDAVALFTGLEDLRRPAFDKGHLDMNIRDQKIFLVGLLTSPRLKVAPSGTIAFNKALDLLTDIEISPELASKLRSTTYTSYLESKDGWLLIPLKITGTADHPSVGPNPAALKKQLQKGIQTEIQKRIFKDGSHQQQQQGERPQDLIKGLFGK